MDAQNSATYSRETLSAARSVMDALVDGLRLPDKRLNDLAFTALARIGPTAVRWLNETAARTNASVYRERLRRVALWISINGRQPGNVSTTMLTYLIDALRVSDQELNEKATSALCHMQESIVGRLIAEATSNRENHEFCMRLLEVVARIGKTPNCGSVFDLTILIGLTSGRVQDAARIAFLSLRAEDPTTPGSDALDDRASSVSFPAHRGRSNHNAVYRH